MSGETLTFDALVALVRRIFIRHGMSEANGAVLAANCVAAERDGAGSHGLFRVGDYLSTIKSGWADGRAEPRLDGSAAASVVAVDARNGFAQPALALARPSAVAKARATGACVIAVRNSHHLGALWLDVEPFVQEGLIALVCVNSVKRLVPWGGREPVFGTNPLAFGVSRQGEEPLIFDQASSAMAFGEIALAAESGHALPPGIGLDRNRDPTTDPKAIVNGGALLPFGGYKGSSIAMMIELLSAALTGGNFSYEVDASADPGARTARTGEFVLLIDPERAGVADFRRRVEDLVGKMVASGQQHLPGARRFQNRKRAAAEGMPVSAAMLETLHGYLKS